MAKLSEPSIIQVHDFGEDKGFNYIVMEYLTGGTLHDRLGAAWQVSDVLAVIRPIAQGLDYAHSQGVIHRDIKPPNILIDSEGRPKLSDFGLALLVRASAGLTKSDSVLGTPEYMSPEQALGRPADNRSDLYSLAVVIYQMLLGQTPFKGDTPSATLLAHIHQSVPLPTSLNSDIDPRLEAALLRGLAKEPDDRYNSGNELVNAFADNATQSDSATDLDHVPTILEPVSAPRDLSSTPRGSRDPDRPKTRPPASSVARRDIRLSDHCLVSDVPDSRRPPINLTDPKTLLWAVDPQKHFNGIRGLAWRIVGVKRDQKNPNTCNVCAFHFDAGHLAEISVLIAGSEDLSGLVRDLGPEKASQPVREFYDLCSTIIVEHDGIAERFGSNGVRGFFNTPIRRIDHVEQAILAATEIQLAASRITVAENRGITVGVSIDTGLGFTEITGSKEGEDYAVLGDVVDMSSRLQDQARSGGILVTEQVYQIVGDLYPKAQRQVPPITGTPQPVETYWLS